jgi:arylsulfatase
VTGYNHHSNNAGSIMETGTAIPGNTGVRPHRSHPMARGSPAEWLQHCGFTANITKRRLGKSQLQARTTAWPTHFRFENFLRIHRRRDEPVFSARL